MERETDLAREELQLKRDDHVLRRLELEAKIAAERRNVWFTSPLLIALLTAVFGLAGAAVGAVFQGYWNARLERQKFEATLIQKALEPTSKEEAARNLAFLAEAGLISEFDSASILRIAKDPNKVPTGFGSGATSGSMPPGQAKQALTILGFYHGPINDDPDPAFITALREFQKSRGLMADGVLGARTGVELRNAVLSAPPGSDLPRDAPLPRR